MGAYIYERASSTTILVRPHPFFGALNCVVSKKIMAFPSSPNFSGFGQSAAQSGGGLFAAVNPPQSAFSFGTITQVSEFEKLVAAIETYTAKLKTRSSKEEPTIAKEQEELRDALKTLETVFTEKTIQHRVDQLTGRMDALERVLEDLVRKTG